MQPLTESDWQILTRLSNKSETIQSELVNIMIAEFDISYLYQRLRSLTAKGLIRKGKSMRGNKTYIAITPQGLDAIGLLSPYSPERFDCIPPQTHQT